MGLNGLTKHEAAYDPAALVDKRSGKPKRVSKKMREVIHGLQDGTYRTKKAAAIACGLTDGYIYNAFRQDHIRKYIDDRTLQLLRAGKLRASQRLVDLIDAKSEHVSRDAASEVLALNGIRAEPSAPLVTINNTNIHAGYVIDLSDPREPRDRPKLLEIPAETQED